VPAVDVTLPANNWKPRRSQLPIWSALRRVNKPGGRRRISAICHRRFGKDELALHSTAIAAHERVADYWHCLPLYAQARKAIWTAVNPHTGRRRIDEAFPHDIRASTNETEMYIRFKNGSGWRVVGSDNPDSLVGTAPAGLVMSEWALSNPSAWAYLAPIVNENGGWAFFITTPRGRNHAHSMHKMAEKSEAWSAHHIGVQHSGFPLALVEEQRAEYAAIFGPEIADSLIDQEYYVSWDAAILGSFWGKALEKVFKEGRIRDAVPYERGFPIHRAWDLGIGDPMAVWFFQVVGREIRLLAYHETQGQGFEYWGDLIRNKMNIRGGTDYVPHDAQARELAGKGKTRIESMIEDGLSPELVPLYKMEDGINAARRILGRCFFHTRTEPGVEKLRHYRAKWDDDRKVFSNKEEHDFSSHCASAFKTLAMAYEEVSISRPADTDRRLIIAEAPGLILPNQLVVDDLFQHYMNGHEDNPLSYQ
jgi:phage terminase large subunit